MVYQARVDRRPVRTVVDVGSSEEGGAHDSKASDIVIRQPRVGSRPTNAVVRRTRDAAGVKAPDKKIGAVYQKCDAITGRQPGWDPGKAAVGRSKDTAPLGGGKDVAAYCESIDPRVR